MITRLKFHRESILAIAKTSRVRKNERRDFERGRGRERQRVHYFHHYIREVNFHICCIAPRQKLLSSTFFSTVKSVIEILVSIIFPESWKLIFREIDIYPSAFYVEYTSEKVGRF